MQDGQHPHFIAPDQVIRPIVFEPLKPHAPDIGKTNGVNQGVVSQGRHGSLDLIQEIAAQPRQLFSSYQAAAATASSSASLRFLTTNFIQALVGAFNGAFPRLKQFRVGDGLSAPAENLGFDFRMNVVVARPNQPPLVFRKPKTTRPRAAPGAQSRFVYFFPPPRRPLQFRFGFGNKKKKANPTQPPQCMKRSGADKPAGEALQRPDLGGRPASNVLGMCPPRQKLRPRGGSPRPDRKAPPRSSWRNFDGRTDAPALCVSQRQGFWRRRCARHGGGALRPSPSGNRSWSRVPVCVDGIAIP